MSEPRTALITGASSGLGASFARQLAARGYQLILVARRQERLERLAAELGARHALRVEVLPADLSQTAGIERVVERIVGQPTLDLLVNNAGFGTTGPFTASDPARQLAMIQVHVVASVRLCQAALPGMIRRGRGSIINVSSVVALLPPLPGNVTYTATKSYLARFSEALQLELSGSGVRVQALCPGLTRTEFHSSPEFKDFGPARTPALLWMTADQVVSRSLRALENGRGVIYVPGWQNKLIVLLFGNRILGPLAAAVAHRMWRSSPRT